jgi:mannosyltransferase
MRNSPYVLGWVVLATILGLLVRTYRLGHPVLGMDEQTTILFTREAWGALLGPIGRIDLHPPYYYLLQKAWSVFGTEPGTMRLLPAMLGTACIPLLFLLGRRLLNARIGVIAAFLLTTAPLHVQQSRELRMYPLLAVSALIAMIGLAYALPVQGRLQRRTAWVVYVIGSVSAIYAHNTAVLLPALATALVLLLWITRQTDRKAVRDCMLASGVVALLAAPWFVLQLGNMSDTLGNYWVPETTLGYALGQISGIYPYPRYIKFFVLVLCVTGIVVLRYRRDALAFIGAFAAGQPMTMWALSYIQPILLIRAMVWPSVLTLLLPAAVIARAARPAVVIALTTVLLLVQGWVIADQFPSRRQATDFSALAHHLSGFDPDHDRLLLSFQMLENQVRLDAPAPFENSPVLAMTHSDRPETIRRFFRSKHVLRTDIESQVASSRRVWIVEEIMPPFPARPQDDVAPYVARIRGMGEEVRRWTNGNLALSVIELRSR